MSRGLGALAALAAAAGLGGCIVPQDDTFFVPLTEARNRPPRIVERTVVPDTRLLTPVALPNCTLTFNVNVADPDEKDVLNVYWYVDHDERQEREDLPITINPNPGGLGEERQQSATWSADLRQAGNPLAVPGDHVVEAIVTDTVLFDQVPQPTRRTLQLADGGVLVDPGYSDSYAWFVKTTTGSCVE